MSDELEITLPEEDDNVEFIVGEEEEKVDVGDLQKRFEDVQREKEELKVKADQVSALSKSFETFGKSFKKDEAPPPQAPYQPYDSKALDEAIMNDMYTTPSKSFDVYFEKKLAPIFQEFAGKQASLNEALLKYDPEKKEMYGRYKEEVESELRKVPIYEKLNNPNYANDVFDKVKARHLDEIIAERIEKAVEERIKSTSEPQKVQKTQFSETSSAPAPKGDGKKIRLSTTQMDEAKRYCARNALNLDYYLKMKYGG